jgi:hypothetical protein
MSLDSNLSNLSNLERHAHGFVSHTEFTYSVLSALSVDEMIGCVYSDPLTRRGPRRAGEILDT